MTVSLWVAPHGGVRRLLAALIAEIAMNAGTPRFAPHLTLVGTLRGAPDGLADGAARLAAGLPRLSITLTSVGASEAYYRSLFARAEGPALAEAHRLARERFRAYDDAPFLPHLSVGYGLGPDLRHALAARVADLLPLTFEARALHVVATSGAVEAWTPVASAPLGRARGPFFYRKAPSR